MTYFPDLADHEGIVATLAMLDSYIARSVSKHDRVILLIAECIREGLVKGPPIVKAIGDLGYNRQHVGLTLAQYRGDDPTRHHWKRDQNGDYSLHDTDVT